MIIQILGYLIWNQMFQDLKTHTSNCVWTVWTKQTTDKTVCCKRIEICFLKTTDILKNKSNL